MFVRSVPFRLFTTKKKKKKNSPLAIHHVDGDHSRGELLATCQSQCERSVTDQVVVKCAFHNVAMLSTLLLGHVATRGRREISTSMTCQQRGQNPHGQLRPHVLNLMANYGHVNLDHVATVRHVEQIHLSTCSHVDYGHVADCGDVVQIHEAKNWLFFFEK